MQHYSVFGGCLHSEVELTDLPAGLARPADWTFTVSDAPPPATVRERVGTHAVEGWFYELFRTADGLRLVFAERYVFDLERSGTIIRGYAADGAADENVRALLLGPVLALALQLADGFCLHGSAVALERRGIAFLAAKFHGKSTLALALTLAGAKLITDDTVAVELGAQVQVRPGIHSVRLWRDSLAQLDRADLDAVVVDGQKSTLTALPRRLLQEAPVPLAAVYILEPVRPDAGRAAAERVALSPAEAAVALACHAKLPQSLLGREAVASQLQRSAAVVRDVPVYQLEIVRNFARLAEVTARIAEWH
jgi:hypothetical protein